jgi:hypothetical protein
MGMIPKSGSRFSDQVMPKTLGFKCGLFATCCGQGKESPRGTLEVAFFAP